MEFERNKLIAACAAALVLIALAAYYGGLFGRGMPDLALSASVPSRLAYSGDIVEFSVLVTNTGSAPVRDADVTLFINGQPLAQKSVTLEPDAAENITMRWLAAEGSYDVRIVADAGNLIAESNEGNNAFSASVSVLPAEEPDLFSHLPDAGIGRAYSFNATRGGMNQLIGIFASGEQASQQFYLGLMSRLYDGRLAILNYVNGSEAAILYLGAEMTEDDFLSSVGAMAGSGFERSRENGIEFFSYGGNITTLCAWHEKGWNKVLMYKQSMPQLNIFNNTIGERTTCLDLVGGRYNSSGAHDFLLPAEDLRARVRLNDSALLEGRARAGEETLYVHGFEDGNSAFLLLVSSAGTVIKQGRCLGVIINESSRSICKLARASLMGKVEMTAFERKQGPFTMMTFIAPVSGTNLMLAEEKAKNVTAGVVFPGVPEYDWSSQQIQLAQCRFPSVFWCSNFTFVNSTLTINLTQLTGHEILLNGFKCTQETSPPNESFLLPTPVRMGANATLELRQPCYITGNTAFNGTVLYLRSRLYVNYTDPATNETRVVEGSLLAIATGIQPAPPANPQP